MTNNEYSHQVLKTFALTENYNRYIIDLIRREVHGKVLEIGCGIGNITRHIAGQCDLTAVDIVEIYLKHLRVDFPGLDCRRIDVSKDEAAQLGTAVYDAVVCINVLEHIEDDHAALAHIFQLLKPGGKLLLFVPALQQIYGELDKDLLHFRRYNKASLSAELERVGYHIALAQYKNMLGVAGWYVNGRVLKRKKFSVIQPLIFDRLVPFLDRVENILQPLPCGMSLFVIAEKKQG